MTQIRWVVNYNSPDTIDDIDLLRTSRRSFFETEKDAKAFAEKQKFKNRPFYWQPVIIKQVLVTREVSEWKNL